MAKKAINRAVAIAVIFLIIAFVGYFVVYERLIKQQEPPVPVRHLVVSKDGRRVMSVTADGLVAIYDAATLQNLMTRRTIFSEENFVTSFAAFSPLDSDVVVTPYSLFAGDLEDSIRHKATLALWDTSMPDKPPIKFVGHNHQVTDVLFSPDGERIFSVDITGYFKVWNAKTGENIYSVQQRDSEGSSDLLKKISYSDHEDAVVISGLTAYARKLSDYSLKWRSDESGGFTCTARGSPYTFTHTLFPELSIVLISNGDPIAKFKCNIDPDIRYYMMLDMAVSASGRYVSYLAVHHADTHGKLPKPSEYKFVFSIVTIDLVERKEILRIYDHRSEITALEVSSDDRFLFYAGTPGKLNAITAPWPQGQSEPIKIVPSMEMILLERFSP